MKPSPVPPSRDSAPELLLDTLAAAKGSFCTWAEVEFHLKDAAQQIRAIREMIANFHLPKR